MSDFAIDATEVTVEAYQECVRAGRCQEPNTGRSCNWGVGKLEVHPVNCVDWNQATAYCAWKGKRLPTEWEWEKAARGTDGRKYPWGNEQVSCRQASYNVREAACDRSLVHLVGLVTTFKVASKPLGVSPYGAHDMIGNVWEWTSSQYPGSTNRVVRGGKVASKPLGASPYQPKRVLEEARASFRNRYDPVFRANSLGFRCAQ